MNQTTSLPDVNTAHGARNMSIWMWGVAVVLFLFAVWILYSQLVAAPPVVEDPEAERIAFEDATGVHVIRVVLVMGGGLVGVHYEVLDPDKALVMHSEDTPPTLIVEKSGASIPFTFGQHGGALETGRGYRLHFPNRGNAVHRGDQVTIKVGDVQLSHIVVQ